MTDLAAPWGPRIEIDDALITAILLLWHHGIYTAFSCQGSAPSAIEPSGSAATSR